MSDYIDLADGRGRVRHGPLRSDDDLPEWVEFRGVRYTTPEYEVIERFVSDSVAEALGGEEVEPDGYDEDGFPSWLLALELM